MEPPSQLSSVRSDTGVTFLRVPKEATAATRSGYRIHQSSKLDERFLLFPRSPLCSMPETAVSFRFVMKGFHVWKPPLTTPQGPCSRTKKLFDITEREGKEDTHATERGGDGASGGNGSRGAELEAMPKAKPAAAKPAALAAAMKDLPPSKNRQREQLLGRATEHLSVPTYTCRLCLLCCYAVIERRFTWKSVTAVLVLV